VSHIGNSPQWGRKAGEHIKGAGAQIGTPTRGRKGTVKGGESVTHHRRRFFLNKSGEIVGKKVRSPDWDVRKGHIFVKKPRPQVGILALDMPKNKAGNCRGRGPEAAQGERAAGGSLKKSRNSGRV